jgi:peptidoglycan-N-acetylglucosamine deacetylase
VITVLIAIFTFFLLLLFYSIIPTVLIRLAGLGITKRIEADGIALTFDDGPNPQYTPQLLDLLKEYGVKA